MSGLRAKGVLRGAHESQNIVEHGWQGDTTKGRRGVDRRRDGGTLRCGYQRPPTVVGVVVTVGEHSVADAATVGVDPVCAYKNHIIT